MKKPFFSIGIIFKNEIRCLERCLKSLQPLREAVPCELVMADTGSDDGSRAVAEKYADILFDFPWVDDFSAARNAVIDRCSGEWYMGVDADEWFSGDATELRAFSKTKNIPTDLVSFTIRNCKSADPEASDNYMDFSALRIMRLASGFRYVGCIHEKFDAKSFSASALVNTLFYHDGYYYGNRAFMEAKRQRNLKLLEKKLNSNPEDLQTLTECIDSMKAADPDIVDTKVIMNYTKRSLRLLHENWKLWGRYGATVYRNAVSVAKLHDQPELLEWAEKAVELYPDSIYTRIDVAYYAFGRCWDEHKFADAVRWSEMYLAAMDDYRANRFDCVEIMRGVIEFASPYRERQLQIVLAQAKLELGEPETARDILAGLDGSAMDETSQVEGYVNIMMQLHRVTELDIASPFARFWEQINCPAPSKKMAETRRNAFLKTASAALDLTFIADELTKEDFLRHSYTLFTALGKDCQLYAFAAMLEETDPAVLENNMVLWDSPPIPVSVLFHALEIGVTFPLPGKPQKIESMDVLANQLAKMPERLCSLVLRGTPMENVQQICWAGALVLAVVQSCNWKEENVKQGIGLARCFVKTERQFLSVCYTPEFLTEENIILLPPIHRFGWYCTRACDALDSGNPHEYVKLLREGLLACEGMKPMVEFLVEHMLSTPPELLRLAEQVRMILAQYPADDPAVAALKQSEMYQKVAGLIENREEPPQ